MKRVKIAFFGAAILALSILAAGCENGTTDSDNNKNPADNKEASSDVKKITISGIDASKSGTLRIYLKTATGERIAYGREPIKNGSATLSLCSIKKDENGHDEETDEKWNDSGSYILDMLIRGNNDYDYFYTDGKSLDQLEISTDNPEMAKLPQYNIKEATTTIPLSKFYKYSDNEE